MRRKSPISRYNRRTFIRNSLGAGAGVLGASLMPPSLLAQSGSPGIRVEKLNYLEIRVADVERSIAFYQDLFGMPVQARDGDRVYLKIGLGNQFMAIRPLQGDETPGITELGYAVTDYDLEAHKQTLADDGYREISPPDITEPGLNNAMTYWVRMRGNTPELHFSDARGLITQLSDPSYCGGSGPLGNRCGPYTQVPAGLFELGAINHFTVFCSDGAGASAYYQEFYGLEVQAFQGPASPVNGIGDGKQFIMFGGRGENSPANIEHASFNMDGFDVEEILAKLTAYGITDRGDNNSRQPGPLKHFISLRMPARGGVEGGTPELYFTDPDGILMQLQDTSYCGGGGYFGEICEA